MFLATDFHAGQFFFQSWDHHLLAVNIFKRVSAFARFDEFSVRPLKRVVQAHHHPVLDYAVIFGFLCSRGEAELAVTAQSEKREERKYSNAH
jgi:hypothetical protein